MDTQLPKPDVSPTSNHNAAPEQELPVDGNSVAASPAASVKKQAPTRTETVIANLPSRIAKSTGENSHASVDQFFSLPERLPIQVFNEENNLQKFGHWGPVVMGAASIVLTFFVWRNTENLTSRQIDLQAQQVQAELSDLRFKFLNDLTAQDEKAKTAAEISLAAHGLKAFPVIHYALGVELKEIRDNAVNVVHRMFQAETNAGREELLKKLMEEFAFPNKTLHRGVVQSLLKIEPLLSPSQRGRVMSFLQQSVVPQTVCLEREGRETVVEAAKFAGSKRADAIPYLTSVVTVARCGDGWLQAIYNLQTIAPEISAQERSTLREKVAQIKQETLDNLDHNISKQELAEGDASFSDFLEDGAVRIEFDGFKKRIEKEFDTLISELSK